MLTGLTGALASLQVRSILRDTLSRYFCLLSAEDKLQTICSRCSTRRRPTSWNSQTARNAWGKRIKNPLVMTLKLDRLSEEITGLALQQILLWMQTKTVIKVPLRTQTQIPSRNQLKQIHLNLRHQLIIPCNSTSLYMIHRITIHQELCRGRHCASLMTQKLFWKILFLRCLLLSLWCLLFCMFSWNISTKIILQNTGREL